MSLRDIPRGGRAGTFRCPECGVENKPGARRCAFCGHLLVAEEVTRPKDRRSARTAAVTVLALAAAGLVVAGLADLGRRYERRDAPTAPAAATAVPARKREAGAACEERIRAEVRHPFRVIALASSLVAEAQGGYVVTGTVDLQSLEGELRRRRYRCVVRAGAGAPAVEDARLE